MNFQSVKCKSLLNLQVKFKSKNVRVFPCFLSLRITANTILGTTPLWVTMENQTLVPLSSGVELFNPDKHFHTFFFRTPSSISWYSGIKNELKNKNPPPPPKVSATASFSTDRKMWTLWVNLNRNISGKTSNGATYRQNFG